MGASVFIGGKAFSQVPSYVPTNGLVGWWPFNGNANDESGNGNNGTVNGATLTTDRFGNTNNAYDFFGSEKINLPNINLGNTFSISIFFTGNQLEAGFSSLIGNWEGDSGLRGFEISRRESNSIGFTYSNDGLNEFQNECQSIFPSTFSWQHLVVKSDGVKIQIYINGNLEYESSISSQVFNNGDLLLVGATRSGIIGDIYSFFWKGKIDDIGMWNRALNECEISDLYNAQLGSFSNTTLSINPTSSAIGSNATLSVSTPIQSIQWQSNPSDVGWVNLSDNSNYNGVNNDTLVVSNLQLSNHNQPFRILACGDTSNIATIQIADTCITNVTVYDTLLTTVTDTLIINTTLSFPAPNNENTILIYPNPASDHITIDNGNFSAMAGYSIKIENNAGQQVFQSAIDQAQFYVDLSTWTGNGLYFVHLIDPQNNTVTVRKIVLQ